MKAKVTFYNNGVIAYTTQKDNKLVCTFFFSTSDFVNFCADNGIKTPLSAIETEPEDYEMTF